MEIIILIVGIVAGAVWWFYNKNPKIQEATSSLINKAGEVIPNTMDVNKDGKVNLSDVKALTSKAEEEAKQIATKVEETVKKTRGRAKKLADLDGDGKVTLSDARVAAKRAKTKVEETVVKKTRGRTKKAQ